MRKILYAIPLSLDYRLPYYEKLKELSNGEFHLLHSIKRYEQLNRLDLVEKYRRRMGENVHELHGEQVFNTYTFSFKKFDREKGKNIPIPIGLWRAIKSVNPNVLITEGFFQWTPIVILYAWLHKIPVFMGYERTPWTERNTNCIKTLHRKITDKFISGYLVNGSETKKYLISIGVDEKKIHIGGMCADSAGLVSDIAGMDKQERESLRRKYVSNGGLLYLFTGQIVVRKGVKYLIEAWKSHALTFPEDALVLIGCGDLYDHFVKKTEAMPSVHFEGMIPYDEVYKYYAIADVAVMPTIEDNWSLVVPEAMACGLPVATSIYNGCHVELVKEGENGFVFDTFDVNSVVKALGAFHHCDLYKMGECSKRLEQPFNTKNCASRSLNAIVEYLTDKEKNE